MSTGVVLDVGSQWTRAGFAGESFPRVEFKSVVGRFRVPELVDGFQDVYCGQEAMVKRGVSRLFWPVREGLIQDWDEMEKLLHHTFYKELMVPPEDTKIIFSLHPLTPVRVKEQMVEMLFETFAVDSICLAQAPAMVMLASGRTSGLVWENGHTCCYAAPVFEGFTLKHAIVKSQLTGEALTKSLLKLMLTLGYSFTTPIEIDLAEKIKAEICYVALDYEALLASKMSDGNNKFRYKLPDGQFIILDEERYHCPEVLFRPSLQGLDCPSIVDDICQSVGNCDLDFQALFYDSIVMSGGSSQFSGLDKRLHLELSQRIHDRHEFRVTVTTGAARARAAWTGGTLLASMDTMKERYLSKTEYGDSGVARVQLKFY